MKIAGFVCEFNPLHYGHKYLIEQIKNDGAQKIICAMSSNFVMRGEPAIFDKFFRTEKALENGIDVVLEIPTIFSIQAADIYARKGIEILINSNVTDIYFGAETNDVKILEQIVSLRKTIEYKEGLKNYLDKGLSFNAASKKAINDLLPISEDILSSPNNLLAIEYIDSIKSINKDIKYHLIKRAYADFHDKLNQNVKIQSASAIRDNINDKNISLYLPYSIQNVKIHKLDNYYSLLKYKIDSSSLDELKTLLFINEGIENKLKKIKFDSIKILIDSLVSKRYRDTKIKRILTALLLNVKKEDLNLDYSKIRVLGFNINSSDLIKEDIFITNITKDSPEYIFKEIMYTKIYDDNIEMNEYKPIIYK